MTCLSNVRRIAFACLLAILPPLSGAADWVALAAQHLEGTTAGGAPYALDLPDHWSGDLVVYAHGIIDPALPVVPPTTQDGFDAIESRWLDLGFAIASSGYRENGYALKDGVQDTHQLTGIFISKFGRPRRVYLVGHSLGAAIEEVLVETYPEQYDGALLMCGLLGGGRMEADYLGNGRVLFDYFFPGVVPFGPFDVPPGLDFSPASTLFGAVAGALVAGFAPPDFRTVQLAGVAGLPGVSPAEIVASGLTIVGFNVRFSNDLLARTHDRIFFDNSATVYSGSFDDAALNRGVERFASTPDAARYLDKYFTPAGDLRLPVLTLHTTRDPANPFFHEAAYARIVAAAGASRFLVQRAVDRYGHCAFTADEMVGAFLDLRGWVETGVPPTDGEPIP